VYALWRDLDTRPQPGQAACEGPSALTIQSAPLWALTQSRGSESFPVQIMG